MCLCSCDSLPSEQEGRPKNICLAHVFSILVRGGRSNFEFDPGTLHTSLSSAQGISGMEGYLIIAISGYVTSRGTLLTVNGRDTVLNLF